MVASELVRVVRVVAVSPGDVQAERNRLELVVDEVNQGVARSWVSAVVVAMGN
jgi:hypothetical protein